MGGMKLVATGRALPGRCISNEELSTYVDTSDEWIRTRTGIHTRYKCEEESCLSLAVEAGRQAMKKAGISGEEIGAVIVATTTADYAFPSVACLVQRELGIGEEALAFDLEAGCTGFMYGMAVAHGLLQTLRKPYILVIGSEQLSRILDYQDRTTCILFGDGAGAAIYTEGSGLFVQKSYSRGNDEVLFCPGSGNDHARLHMNGNEVFRFATKTLSQVMEEVFEEAGVTMDQVDWVVCHQANERIIRHVQKKYPGQEDKFYLNIDRYGNTSSASIPIALDEMFEKGMLKEGMKVMLVGFGAGLTWSGALFEI